MKVGVIFGGKSVEHDISIITASMVLKALKKDWELYPIYVKEDNSLRLWPVELELSNLNKNKGKKIRFIKGGIKRFKKVLLDVVFVAGHGNNVEDGHFAALLDFYGIPHTAANIYSSSIGQDKSFQKDILSKYKIKMAEYVKISKNEFFCDNYKIDFTYPYVIKPNRLGSSISIHKVDNKEEFKEKMLEAFKYDNNVIVEKYIPFDKELNVAILGDDNMQKVSVVEEVFHDNELLDFSDKYLNCEGKVGSRRRIPADIPLEKEIKLQIMSKEIFTLLDCFGVSRIDYFMHQDEIYFNEINIVPGSLSFYLFEPLGMEMPELLETLMKLAIKRQENNERLITDFKSQVLNKKKGIKK